MIELMVILNSPWPYLTTATFVALLGFYAWRQPRRPGVHHFIRMVGVWLLWALLTALTTVVKSSELRHVLWALQSFCALLQMPLLLMVVLEYTGRDKWLGRRSLLLLSIPAFVFVLVALTAPHTAVSKVNQFGIEVIVPNNLIQWTSFAYVSILMLIILGMLISSLLRAPAFRIPILLLMLGQIVPTLGFVALDPLRMPVQPIQITILLSTITLLAFFLALYKYELLRVVPVARDIVIQNMPYALLVLDAENHLVDFNAAANALPDLPGPLVLRQAASRTLGGWWERLAPLIGKDPISQDVIVQTNLGKRIFRVRSLRLEQASGWRLGQVLVLDDVTQLRLAQQQQAHAQRALDTLHERERLSRDLHDTLGQVFAFINAQGQAIHCLLARGEISAADVQLARLVEVAREADVDIRESILGLRATLSDQGLFPSLAHYLARYEQNYGIHTKLTGIEVLSAGALEPLVEVQLLRVLQEALTNVRKHARAHHAEVVFAMQDDCLQVKVQDDGRGFDLHAGSKELDDHVGLRVMRERAEEVGGTLDVDSEAGKGTHVVIKLPITKRWV